MRSTRTAAVVAAGALWIGLAGVGPASAEPDRQLLRLVDISRQVAHHDLGQPGDSPGDIYVFDSSLRHPSGADAGTFPSTCIVDEGTSVRCVGTLLLQEGTLRVEGTPDLSKSSIEMVVVGGSGRYSKATGFAYLRPTGTAGVSELTVRYWPGTPQQASGS